MQVSFRQRSQDLQLSKTEMAHLRRFNRTARPTSSSGGHSDRCSNHLRCYNFQPRPLPYSTELRPLLRQSSVRGIPLLANSATKSSTSARVGRLGAETFCSPPIRPLQLSSNRCVWSDAYKRPTWMSASRKLIVRDVLGEYGREHTWDDVTKSSDTFDSGLNL